MNYKQYFTKFNENDNETVKQYIPNDEAIPFLLEHAPRLYCPDGVIEETFAFRCWTLRKHIKRTEDGYLLSEFLVDGQMPWAGKHNTINAPLTHHLNEARWLGISDKLIDYVDFFINGEGSALRSGSAFAYHTPALYAMYEFCLVSGREDYLSENAEGFERYFLEFERRHLTGGGLYSSNDDREGTEYSISGTTPELKRSDGIRPLFNSCMCADAAALSDIFKLSGDGERAKRYAERSRRIAELINERMWDGDFYKAIHPADGDLCRAVDCSDIPEECNARELVGYIPWVFGIPCPGREAAFSYLKDESVFSGGTGFTTADISHPRFMYYPERGCTWNGKVWPYATSYAIGAVIRLLEDYKGQSVIDNRDLYSFIKKYAEMHYSVEDGVRVNFIDEVMMPYEPVWCVREMAKRGEIKPTGGPDRGKDYNHSTFIDLVIRGLLGVSVRSGELSVSPRIEGIWDWFRLENLSYRGKRYNVYYDCDGRHFGRGAGVIVEEI